MKAKVSVVVPVYNGADSIGECLDNLTNQTLKELEIICVNDGSKDNSLEQQSYRSIFSSWFSEPTVAKKGYLRVSLLCLYLIQITSLTQDFTVRLKAQSSSLWITSPERSLGSNQVVLGGMILPVSAMSMSCFIDTG